MDYMKRCDRCQRFVDLHVVASPWPFHKWGIDILGPFPMAPSQVKFLMVAMDYFTKWIEAEPMATITAERVKRFIWKKIVCRFGLPAEIVSDNGTQFASSITARFCQDLDIKQSFTSVEHPQANGQAEVANRVILRGLRRRLEEAKGRWAEELPQVLWSYHTTPHSTTDETPFRLTYGSEAMIPPPANEEELGTNLDLLPEVREIAHIKEYAAKARVARKYGQRVIHRDFEVKDLVLRKTTLGVEKNKLTPKWEGPFRITERVGKGAYHLEHLDGRRIAHLEHRQLEKLQDPKRTTIETDLGSEELKLQDPKRTAIETDSGSEELKLQDPKRTAIETDPGSEESSNKILNGRP
ncbi:Retrovirus-related Pol polyprotein, partial [Mucuna pruriens]